MKRSTPERLIDSAVEVFAEKGYAGATIAEICDRADANVALVNYHFGDKENLYQHAWHRAFEQASESYPMRGDLAADAPAEEKLRAFIRSLLGRTLSSGSAGNFTRLMVKEMAQPTSALADIVEDALRPQTEYMLQVLRELLGNRVPARNVQMCMLSVVSQCLFVGFNKPVRERLLKEKDLADTDMEEVADHIFRFSIAGLRNAKGDRKP